MRRFRSPLLSLSRPRRLVIRLYLDFRERDGRTKGRIMKGGRKEGGRKGGREEEGSGGRVREGWSEIKECSHRSQ